MNTYQNPDQISLEKLELVLEKDGVIRTVPGLSQEWTEKRIFLQYEPPKLNTPEGVEIVGAKNYWLELVSDISTDLKWLMSLKFYKFWSNVVYNPTIGDCLVSCLQEFPTFFNLDTFPNDAAMRDALEMLRRTVFLTFVRLVKSRDSKEEFMTHEAHGQLLYNKFLLTVPMMLDICQLYGRENTKVVEKMLITALKLQPSYSDDLYEAANFFLKVFKNIDEKFEDYPKSLTIGAVALSERRSRKFFSPEELEDLIVHVLDVSSNISVFLDCFPPARDLLCTEDFANEIIHHYGNTIPELYKRLEPLARDDETIARYMELKHRLDVTRIELLKIFRTITYHDIARLLDAPEPSKVPSASADVDRFVDFLDKAVAEREFLLDYNASYPVETDLSLISQISNDVDPVKCNFIRRSVYSEFVEVDRRKDVQSSTTTNVVTSAPPIPSSSQDTLMNAIVNDGSEKVMTNGSASKSPAELASLISGVKDILCDLGEGFIERCLIHYNYNVASVVNGVFENSLPEFLKALDKTLPYIPSDPEEPSAAVDHILGAERLNVFDNDEFDIMTRDSIDTSRIHKGKRKEKYKTFGQLLDDKSYRKDASNVYEKYNMIQDEYDDEYDDTYDSHDVGSRGVDEPLEMDGRAFTTPRVLRWNEKREADDEEEEENSEEVDVGPSRAANERLNFIQDPAEMRARAEQRRLSKRGGGAAGGSRGPHGDLIGKPKGQGNDKNVLVNRDRKNTNKASRANHNRRSGADYKRKQGMVP